MKDIVDELREIQRMNTTLHGAQMAARAADEIERLRAERDDARREACQWCGLFTKETGKEVARKNHWDCFEVRSEP